MLFCGQCGFRLGPDDTLCPRCGAPVTPDQSADPFAESPTVSSPGYSPSSTNYSSPQNPSNVDQPQKLVLRPGSGNDLGPQEATKQVEAADYGSGAPRTSSPQNMANSYPGYGRSNTNYPTQQASYPGYPAQSSPYQQPYPVEQHQTASTSSKGRTTGLVLILLGLLFIIVAMALFVMQRNNAFGNSFVPSSAAISAYHAWAQIPQHGGAVQTRGYLVSIQSQAYSS